jgi:hypothetical protein
MPHRKDLEGESGRFKSEGSGAETGDQKNSAKRFPKNGVFSQTLGKQLRSHGALFPDQISDFTI